MSYRYQRQTSPNRQVQAQAGNDRVTRLPPFYYIHVIDKNRNVTHVEVGPQSFVRKDHQQIVKSPTLMVTIPPRHYCVVSNPVVREDKAPVFVNGQAKLSFGQFEVRLYDDWRVPFPLYPGEKLSISVSHLEVIHPDSAFHLKAISDFNDDDEKKTKRLAGDEWLLKGPGTYIPRVQCTKVQEVKSTIIQINTALLLKAKVKFTDRKNVERKAGEQWLVKEVGSYLPSVEEQVVQLVYARVLTEKKALHLLALHSFTDVYNIARKAGEEWLVTKSMTRTSLHLPDVHERVVKDVHATVLSKLQYCVIVNPVVDGVPKWLAKQLRLGEATFFLQPGEKLDRNVQQVRILGAEEALLVGATLKFSEELDGTKRDRSPGEQWMVYGPRKYVPPVEIIIIEERNAIPLDKNEGIYVRDKTTGEVTTKRGELYMLKPNEELWEKELEPLVQKLLAMPGTYLGVREQRNQAIPFRVKHKAVTYRVPHNAAVQVYDYKKQRSRVVFGPEMVMLEPDEDFTIVSLSGGEPKRPGQIVSFALQLGPDFMRDTVIVETSDHAQLRLKLCYNWRFQVDKDSEEEDQHRIFSVRDFVGDTCKNIASSVRGVVATVPFEAFHKGSNEIIRKSVFGTGDDGVIGSQLLFAQNLLEVTNVDIQSVEPVEQRTRDALQKSVQLAIEIATSSQEALANHEALKEEQISQGKLQRKKIQGQAKAEAERKNLVTLKANTASTRATGQAKAEAQAEAESALIQARCSVAQAEKKAEALKIRSNSRLAHLKSKRAQELHFKKIQDDLEIEKAGEEAKLEAEKFAKIVKAIGTDTITDIAKAGPEMQAKLLAGLGLEGFLITDGTSPINLFNTASGLVESQ